MNHDICPDCNSCSFCGCGDGPSPIDTTCINCGAEFNDLGNVTNTYYDTMARAATR